MTPRIITKIGTALDGASLYAASAGGRSVRVVQPGDGSTHEKLAALLDELSAPGEKASATMTNHAERGYVVEISAGGDTLDVQHLSHGRYAVSLHGGVVIVREEGGVFYADDPETSSRLKQAPDAARVAVDVYREITTETRW